MALAKALSLYCSSNEDRFVEDVLGRQQRDGPREISVFVRKCFEAAGRGTEALRSSFFLLQRSNFAAGPRVALSLGKCCFVVLLHSSNGGAPAFLKNFVNSP